MQRKTKWQPVGSFIYFCLRYQSTTAARQLEFSTEIQCCLLVRNSVSFGRLVARFRRNIQPPSSGLKSLQQLWHKFRTARLRLSKLIGWESTVNFTFMGPCIVNVFKQNQQDAALHNGIYYYNALHVSGGSSTHHQELKTVDRKSVV